MATKHDVIIIGAGPSGATAAYELALRGVKPLLLEKAGMPRYKACGGGLQHKTLNLLPLDLSQVIENQAIEDVVYNINFSHKFKHNISRSSEKPLIYCVKREKFDTVLCKKAIEKGATLLTGQHVKSISLSGEKINLKTNDDEFICDILIGADGASSTVAKSFKMLQDIKKSVAIDNVVVVDNDKLNKQKGTIMLDWGTVPSGYAWLFPKSDCFSVGVGSSQKVSKHLNIYLDYFKDYAGLPFQKNKLLRGHILPSRSLSNHIVNGRCLLIGDAAGLVDPFTGEGIYQSIYSGKLAAAVVSDFYFGRINNLWEYELQVNINIMKDIMNSRILMSIFNSMPKRSHKLMEDDRVWDAFCKIVRGEKNYSDLFEKLGPFKFIWGPAKVITSYIEKKRIAQFTQNSCIPTK